MMITGNETYLADKMRKALVVYWEEQGMIFTGADLPSYNECLQMLIAIRPYFGKEIPCPKN